MRAGIRLNFAAYTLTRMPFGGSRPAESRCAKRPIPQDPTACAIQDLHRHRVSTPQSGSTRCAFV